MTANPEPAVSRADVLREAADICDEAGAVYTSKALNDHAYAAFTLMERFQRKADEAEYVATPCSVGGCEPGGEPCATHERLMAHAEGDHELCQPDCGERPAVVSSPPATDRATLRDRIAETMARADGWEWAAANFSSLSTPATDRYRRCADAVLAVLPPPADRAAVLREAADDLAEYIAVHGPTSRTVAAWRGVIGFLCQLAGDTETHPDFFQPGRTYTREHHASTVRFHVRFVDDSPEGVPYRVAFGWRTEDGDVCASPFDSDDFTGWIDVADPPAAGVRQPDTETPTDEDPARIDRLRPEFFECASVEAIDAQIQRAQRQQRNWGSRVQKLTGLRQTRVAQKEAGVWPDAAVSGRPAADDNGEETP